MSANSAPKPAPRPIGNAPPRSAAPAFHASERHDTQPAGAQDNQSAASTSEGQAAALQHMTQRPYHDPSEYKVDAALQAAIDRRTDSKEPLHVVVLGHVDAGKSTLMGRMIADLGFADERTVRKTMQEAQSAGRGSFGWAWAFDERPEERSHGVTIDVSTRHIETDRCDTLACCNPTV